MSGDMSIDVILVHANILMPIPIPLAEENLLGPKKENGLVNDATRILKALLNSWNIWIPCIQISVGLFVPYVTKSYLQNEG